MFTPRGARCTSSCAATPCGGPQGASGFRSSGPFAAGSAARPASYSGNSSALASVSQAVADRAKSSARSVRQFSSSVRSPVMRPSVLLQLLGEHHKDAAGTADVRELVDVLIGRHTAKRTASVLRGYLKGLIDVVDREGDAMHADLVGTSGLRLDRFGVDVLEELKATVTVRRLEHRDFGVIAIKADGSVGPLTTDRVTAEDREAEVGEKGDRCFEVANGDADVLKFDGHAWHATEPGRSGWRPSGRRRPRRPRPARTAAWRHPRGSHRRMRPLARGWVSL